jgi:hypothetical protein
MSDRHERRKMPNQLPKKAAKIHSNNQYNGNERPAKFYTLFRRKTPLIYTAFIFYILFYNPVPG